MNKDSPDTKILDFLEREFPYTLARYEGLIFYIEAINYLVPPDRYLVSTLIIHAMTDSTPREIKIEYLTTNDIKVFSPVHILYL